MSKIEATAEDVRYAYRLLLGREPDPSGFRHHVDHVSACPMSPVDFARSMMLSDEFKASGISTAVLDEVAVQGVKIYPWRGDGLIGSHLLATGDYEPHVLPLFLDSIRPGDVVLDVGANIGIYSLLAASRAGPAGKVFSIEPVPKNVQSLCAGIRGNSFENISVLPVAASDKASVIGILRHTGSSNGIVDANAVGAGISEFVPTQRLDVLLSFLERLDVIKLDIEGHEPIAWGGLKSLVHRHRPVIFTEFSPVAIKNHSRVAAERYLEMLFEVAATDISVIHLSGDRRECRTVDAVMEEWRVANERVGQSGELHLDLMVETRDR